MAGVGFMVAFLPAYDARGRARDLFLNGFVELVAYFSKQVFGDADRLAGLGAVGVAHVGD